MLMHLVLAIYSFARNRLFLGLFFFSMAYGTKAGALLLIPGMLGLIQLNYGTFKLILSTAFLLGFQVLIALPFLLTETTIKDYIIRSKLTGAGRNGIQKSNPLYDTLAANRDLTIFWGFLPFEAYYSPSGLGFYSKLAIPLVNLWYFFIRKNYFLLCVNNLLNTFKETLPGVDTHMKRRRTIEVLLILYMGGVAVMPGGHY